MTLAAKDGHDSPACGAGRHALLCAGDSVPCRLQTQELHLPTGGCAGSCRPGDWLHGRQNHGQGRMGPCVHLHWEEMRPRDRECLSQVRQ